MAEKRTIELEIKESGFKSLKAQLREAQADVAAMSEKFGATSREAANAAKAAGLLKDQIEDAKMLTDSFNPDAKFKALSSSIGGVLNGFQAYEGAMGLIGVESEELQATLLKVQSAMALSQGIQGALEAKDSFVALGSVVKEAFGKMTAASKAFMVTGIGLLIAGVGLLVANWESVSQALGAATDAQRLNSKVIAEATTAISKEVNAADALSNSLKDETLNRAEKVRLIKEFQADYPGLLRNVNLEKDSIKSINEQLGDNIKLLQLQAEAKALAAIREETYTKKSQLQLQLQTEAIENAGTATFNYGESAANGFLGFSSGAENAANATKKLGDFQNSSTKSLEKQIKSIDDSEKSLNKKIDALKKTGAATGELTDAEKKAEEAETKLAEERAEKRKSELEQLKQFIKDATKANLDGAKSEQQVELDNIELKYKEQIALAKKYGKDTTQLIEAQKNEQNLVNTKYIQLELDAEQEKQDKLDALAISENEKRIQLEDALFELERSLTETKLEKELMDLAIAYDEKYALAADNAELIKLLDEQYVKDKAVINKDAADAEIALSKLTTAQKIEAVEAVAATFAQLANLLGEQTAAGKAAAIAAATIETFLSAQKAYSATVGIPFVGPVLAPINAGIAIAAGIKNIKAITSVKTPNGGGGGGNIPTAPSGGGGVSAPNFNIVGNSGINQLAELGGQPIQAYVVSGEVTSAQALDRNRIQNASF